MRGRSGVNPEQASGDDVKRMDVGVMIQYTPMIVAPSEAEKHGEGNE